MRQLQVHRSAPAEIARAMRYYEAQGQGLGLEFAGEVDATVQQIRNHPDAGAPLTPKVRRRLLEGFPYGVIYTLAPGRIRIIAVMHMSRRPNYWAGRR